MLESMIRTRTYLDYAAAAPVKKSAVRAFARALSQFGNPSSPHLEGRTARTILEDARTSIARLMEVKSDAVLFTGSATEANALVCLGVAEGHALYLPTAHASVFENMRRRGNAEPIAMKDGGVDFEAFKTQIRPDTMLVSIELICGETGMRINPKEVRTALESIGNKTALIHVDASQAPLVESIERARLSADLVTLDASKVGGVRGIGVLVAPRHAALAPLYEGGGQERGLRSGTESPVLAAAFAAALQDARRSHERFAKSSARMRAELLSRMQKAHPAVLVNEGKDQAPHILNLSFPGIDTDYLSALLDAAGFAVSTKSACETDAEGSRVVFAMTGDAARARATLRISWGPETPASALMRFAAALSKELRFLEENRVSAKI